MKKVILFSALGVIFGATLAYGQTYVKYKADIPFSFHINGIHMPADQYEIVKYCGAPQTFQIRAHDLTTAVFMVPQSMVTKAKDTPKLLFRRYGDEYFLAEVHREGGILEDLTVTSGKHEDEARLNWNKKIANADAEPIKVVLNLSH